MSYFVNPVETEKCVFLTHEGETPMVEVAAARQEVGELLTARRWNRIVVDITTMRSVPKGADLFALGKSLSRRGPRSVRIALIVRPDQTKRARLIERMARNGGVFLTFFMDAEKAEAWVQGDPSVKARRLFQLPQQPVVPGQNQQQQQREEGRNA